MDIGTLIIIAIVLFVGFSLFSGVAKARGQQQAASAYGNAIEQAKHQLLTQGGTPALDPSEYGYRPVAGETLLAVQEGASRMEMRSTGRYANAGPVISIPIMKGVRYRIATGRYQSEKRLTATATGRLLLTDRAIVFESPQKNERITWTQVAGVELAADGYGVSKRNGPPRIYSVQHPDPVFGAIAELLLSRDD